MDIEKQTRLNEIAKRVNDLEEKISEKFQEHTYEFSIPDNLPSHWGKKRLRVNIPFDNLNELKMEPLIKDINPLIRERSELRKQEVKIMIELGIINAELKPE